jgi:hypothetical protein
VGVKYYELPDLVEAQHKRYMEFMDSLMREAEIYHRSKCSNPPGSHCEIQFRQLWMELMAQKSFESSGLGEGVNIVTEEKESDGHPGFYM